MNDVKQEPYQFTVLWTNNNNFTRKDMTKVPVSFRHLGDHATGGLSCKAVYIDHIKIVYRPSDSIDNAEFVEGDDVDHTWRAETSDLMVRMSPGVRNTLLLVEDSTNHQKANTSATEWENRNLSGYGVHRQTWPGLVYSCSLTLAPNVDGNEDYWVRTYRPVRDVPCAHHWTGIGEIELELHFPMLLASGIFGNRYFASVPDYRIVTVMIQFSVHI